jgi:DNA-directed RNA polymerase I, II, and III subunit RPABC2
MADKEDYDSDIEEIDDNDENPEKKVDENDSVSDENDSAADEEEEDEEEMDENLENYNDDGNRDITGFIDNTMDEDLDDEEDEEDENYLQKFEENINKTIIQDSHPELHCHNYKEVEAMCKIVRDANGNIIDPLHTTIPFVTRYEKARIIGERAKQINAGGSLFIEVEPNVIDGYLIALEEFNQKKIPFIIQRPLPNGGCEYWRLKDLDVL